MKSRFGRTIDWRINADGRPEVVMINQILIPHEFKLVSISDVEAVAKAIETMLVRGAPAIGAAGALGGAVAVYEVGGGRVEVLAHLERACQRLASTRPTAVNLFWGIDRMKRAITASATIEPFSLDAVRQAASSEAMCILDDDEQVNRALGKNGASLIPESGARILTHCNAGALACVGYGTALGVIRAAVEAGKPVKVYADETRPRLQGMKLTAWELMQDGIDVTVITDNTAGYLMSLGEIDCVIVGADRIAANGDAANKIGTYSVAVLAHAHNIPFYVAAPISTVDVDIATGAQIPIEQRDGEEITRISGSRIAPDGVKTLNYGFDVTPARLITAIITERGIARAPYGESLGFSRAPWPPLMGGESEISRL